MSNWDNFAPWDSNDNDNQNNNTFDMQFNDIKKNLTHTYARDDINDQIFLKGSGYRDAKSYHLHTVPKTYIKADPGLKAGYEALYRTIFPSLPKDIKEFIYEVRDEAKV